ncbi:hypothetical protein D1007_28208 [Hordeum vulgare]|nr:hypothetical protein D1007_28208 [Hordeum vulgare]
MARQRPGAERARARAATAWRRAGVREDGHGLALLATARASATTARRLSGAGLGGTAWGAGHGHQRDGGAWRGAASAARAGTHAHEAAFWLSEERVGWSGAMRWPSARRRIGGRTRCHLERSRVGAGVSSTLVASDALRTPRRRRGRQQRGRRRGRQQRGRGTGR